MMKRRTPTLESLTAKDEKGRAFLEFPPIDPWGQTYVLEERADGELVAISNGPDGKRGTADDILYPAEDEPKKKKVKKER